jgi:hypothetical protein
MRTPLLLLALPVLLIGCQPPDPRAECARLQAETVAVVNRNPKPHGMRFALACPDQHREHQEAPEHLEGVLQNLCGKRTPRRMQQSGSALRKLIRSVATAESWSDGVGKDRVRDASRRNWPGNPLGQTFNRPWGSNTSKMGSPTSKLVATRKAPSVIPLRVVPIDKSASALP